MIRCGHCGGSGSRPVRGIGGLVLAAIRDLAHLKLPITSRAIWLQLDATGAMPRHRVQAALVRLEARGAIAVHRRTDRGRSTGFTYRLAS